MWKWRFFFFFLKLNKVLLSQYLIRTWLSFSWVRFIKKYAINVWKQLSLRNLSPKSDRSKMQIVSNSTPAHFPSVSLFILLWSFIVLRRVKTLWSLSTSPLSPAAPSHAPSPSFLPLCPVIPHTHQAPSVTWSSVCCSFGMGHFSFNCWPSTLPAELSFRATFSKKPSLTFLIGQIPRV